MLGGYSAQERNIKEGFVSAAVLFPSGWELRCPLLQLPQSGHGTYVLTRWEVSGGIGSVQAKDFRVNYLTVQTFQSRSNVIERLSHKDRLCGLVVRVPGYTTEMYCISCEVRTEFIYVM
jgi:hypothetical protein